MMSKWIKPTKYISLILFVFVLISAFATTDTTTAAAVNPDCIHDFEVVGHIDATPTTDARIIHRCRLCQVEFIETVYVPGEWNAWSINREPTCTQAGQRIRTRISGGAVQSETQPTPPLGNRWQEELTRPTCTPPGFTTRTCQTCGTSYTVDNVQALGRQWGEWIIQLEPQEGIEGRKYRECYICSEREYAVIEPLPISVYPPTTITPPQATPIPEPEPIPEPTPIIPYLPGSGSHWFGMQEAVIVGANVIIWPILFLILFHEFGVFIWAYKSKKELFANKRFEESGGDGYEHI